MTRRMHWLAVGAAVGIAGPALAVTLPSNTNISQQTSSPNRCAHIGDWYTTDGAGTTPNCTGGGTTSSDRIHRFYLDVTEAMLAAGGGSVTLTVNDAEINGSIDEVAGTTDPARFELLDYDGGFLQGQTLPSGTADGTSVNFTITTAGAYQVTSSSGARFLFGDSTVDLNDDDNSYSLTTATDGLLGQTQSSMQHFAGGNLTHSFYFFVGPATATLFLRNFDLDGGGSVSYIRPGGGSVAGTASGNGVWNGAGTLNTGSDTVGGLATALPSGSDIGLWEMRITSWTPNNQLILEANDGAGNRLPLFDPQPDRAGSFTISPDTTLDTGRGVAVDHPFSIRNTFVTNDVINLTLSGTDPNYTAVLLDSGGSPLTDADGDGNLDTGILTPGQTVNLILRVTPNASASVSDTTVVSAVSFMDGLIGSSDTTRSVTKVTRLAIPEMTKSVLTDSDPVNGTSNPKAIPGATLIYRIDVANQGEAAADADSLVITDAIPANTVLRVIDFSGSVSGPVEFLDGTPASGVSYSFVSLGDPGDDVAFSDDGGASYTYTPVDSGDGTDPAVTHLRISPKGALAGSGSGSPGFAVRFKVKLQ